MEDEQSQITTPQNFQPSSLLSRLSHNSFGAAFFGVAFTAICGFLLATLSTKFLDTYGWVLFMGVPFFCGCNSVFLFNMREERHLKNSLKVAALSIILLGVLITVFALDGLICILMALPLAVVVAFFGALLGDALAARYRGKKNPLPPVIGMIFVLPLLMGFEANLKLEPPLRKVVSFVDIEAPPDAVWKNVVAFSTIPEPSELIFKVGIAYPQNARIKGQGVGAIRYCNFSTGAFVEPIRVWDEPRLLRFAVTKNPSPLREISLYRDLQPPHLHDFMISRQGQFKLIPLGKNKTRLEGTTWYYHRLWPAFYWGAISDTIIHKIHYRVLDHIKLETEGKRANFDE